MLKKLNLKFRVNVKNRLTTRIYLSVRSLIKTFSLISLMSMFSFAYATSLFNENLPNENDYRNWVKFLASDEMKGRKNGSDEIEKASIWIAKQFELAGLKPLINESSFFQEYPALDKKPYRNVIGFLPGSNPIKAQEYIVLSAHYDHIGQKWGVVFNGADDNASGVSAMIGMAHHLRQLKPERSILFIAWSGEELGFLGSRHYVRNPVLPLSQMILNLNFEMVGHTQGLGKNQFWMTGAELSSVFNDIQSLALKKKWQATVDPYSKLNLFWRSDNSSFAAISVDNEKRITYGVPAHTISTWGREGHYHMPEDDFQTLDYENLNNFVKTVSFIVNGLSAKKNVPFWQSSFEGYKFKSLENFN